MAASNVVNACRIPWAEGFAPDPKLTVSEWADRNRQLSTKASAEPGRWRTARTPYLREVMDALSPTSPVQRVVAMFAAQTGKTECLLNWMGFSIDLAPAPFLMVQPRVEDAKKYSRQRIDPMLEATESLRAKISERRARDAGNTVFQKEFPGGLLSLTGANSGAGLRSMPARYLAMDEVDAYKPDIDEEGDPIALAEARTSTFFRRKIALTSTPTIEGRSKIADEYSHSDRSQYWVPCPDCNQLQLLEWTNLRWETDEKGVAKPETAMIACTSCGVLIPEHKKTWMLTNGRWIARAPELSNRVRGFQLNGLYTPLGWTSWAELVREFHKAQGNQDLLRTFVNTRLAETWKEKGDAPEWEHIYLRRESYKIGTVPARGLVLTAGVDVQKDRIEFEVRAWGRAKESWSIEYRVIPGDVSTPAPWAELTKVLGHTWRHEYGLQLQIRMLAIDSGFATNSVYDWVRKQSNARVIAIKGQSGHGALIEQPRAAEVTSGGKRLARGVKVWPVSVDMAKAEFYGWLRLPAPTQPERDGFPPGFVHFPEYGEDYFRQLTSEQVVVHLVRGYRKYVWELKRGTRNEALDCAVYNRAAIALLAIDRWSEEQWQELEQSLRGQPPPPPPPRRERSGYMDRFRDRGDGSYLSRWRDRG